MQVIPHLHQSGEGQCRQERGLSGNCRKGTRSSTSNTSTSNTRTNIGSSTNSAFEISTESLLGHGEKLLSQAEEPNHNT